VLWAYALGRTTAGRMGSMTYLVPPIAIALGCSASPVSFSPGAD
jgi:hypothetical protein